MSQKQLAQAIVARSFASSWAQAKREWALESVYFASAPDECLCGHFPIIELCVLRNQQNGAEAIVGNVCVKKFLGLPSDRIFNGLKRIQANTAAALNEAAIRYAHTRSWINDWEQDFYLNTWRKRELTGAQAAKRREINELVLARVAADTRPRQASAEV